jgi:hypothetical protein
MAPLVALAALLVGASVALAQSQQMAGLPLVGLTMTNRLVHFDSLRPSMVHGNVAVQGLLPGEVLVGIDFRPATGQLIGLSSGSRLYSIDAMTGMAMAIGNATFDPTLSGAVFGFDFNPTVDRIRVTSDAGQDLRLHPDTAAVAAVDGTLAYAMGDAQYGMAPNITGSAYTNNMAGATTTTLYGIDANLGTLVTQNPPNDGILNTVGPLGLKIADLVGFDIAPDNDAAYAALRKPGDATSGLYLVNLASGAASLVGPIGGDELIRDLAVKLQPTVR